MNVYEKHDNHFFDTMAAAIFKGPTQVGTIAVKYTKAGVAHVYLHSFGDGMVYGKASGYGYDKVGAALASAIPKEGELPPLYTALKDVTYDGQWRELLNQAGFTIHNVI